jgi:uncharacterized protein (DUF2252 family)
MEHPTAEQEQERGRAARKAAPRRSHGDWTPAPDRPDPVGILLAQDETRSAPLLPIRHGRMDLDAFAFYRGAAAIMAADLAATPVSGLETQICGDAHLSNLGVFGSPERQLLFDLNDFDETLRGPWEWDLKRLVTSFEIAGRSNGYPADARRDVALACARAYRLSMADFAAKGVLDTWYARANVDDLMVEVRSNTSKQARKSAEAQVRKARSRTHLQALQKLTEVVDGQLRIKNDPPLLAPLSTVVPAEHVEELRSSITETFRQYRESLPDDRSWLLEQFRPLDMAHKVVGVGSVGTRAFILLLQGRGDGDPLLLQMKEASTSVLEPHLGPSPYDHPGRRVVEGQRMMQAASDVFLGWSSSADGRHYYWRQLRDMKGSTDVATYSAEALAAHARLCGWSLARAHARSGSPVAISSYLGGKDVADEAMAEFARRYADQNEQDFAAHRQAIADGRIEARSDL